MQSPHGITASAFRPSVMGKNGMVTSGHVLRVAGRYSDNDGRWQRC